MSILPKHKMTGLIERARARAHHHFLNTVTHDLFIELAEKLETYQGIIREYRQKELPEVASAPEVSRPPSEAP